VLRADVEIQLTDCKLVEHQIKINIKVKNDTTRKALRADVEIQLTDCKLVEHQIKINIKVKNDTTRKALRADVKIQLTKCKLVEHQIVEFHLAIQNGFLYNSILQLVPDSSTQVSVALGCTRVNTRSNGVVKIPMVAIVTDYLCLQ
jgi:hypothetical protein